VKARSNPLIVLIADDDPGDVLLIEEALETTGNIQAVHVARDGQEAVAFLHRTGKYAGAPRPDVVFLDLNMPRKNGRQVLAEIKSDPQLASIPILVFTTSQDPDDILTAYSLHANAYVTKPINLDDFTTIVARIQEFFTQIANLPTPADPNPAPAAQDDIGRVSHLNGGRPHHAENTAGSDRRKDWIGDVGHH
jgi:CheY-like chemotaxis protein